jgi:hypothetical protein
MPPMSLQDLSDESEQLAEELYSFLLLSRYDSSERVRISDLSCTLALEHWDAARKLFASALLPSALVIHRAQFEALVRSVWSLYAASEDQLAKLATTLNLDTEQAAKNLPQVAEMMQAIAVKAPPEPYIALLRFKDNSWKALNSYVHAGIHPLRRHEEGYPLPLIEAAFRNANGLAIFSGMQAVVLSGMQPLQKNVLNLAARYPNCMPPSL